MLLLICRSESRKRHSQCARFRPQCSLLHRVSTLGGLPTEASRQLPQHISSTAAHDSSSSNVCGPAHLVAAHARRIQQFKGATTAGQVCPGLSLAQSQLSKWLIRGCKATTWSAAIGSRRKQPGLLFLHVLKLPTTGSTSMCDAYCA